MLYVTSIERLAKEEGVQETLRETIVDVLRVRFQSVPPVINEMLDNRQEPTLLRQLHLQAVTIDSVEEFQQLLSQHIHPDSGNPAS